MFEIILGCMFSGKSSELQRRVKRSKSIKKKVLVVNHKSDSRYGTDNASITHDLQAVAAVKVNKLAEIEHLFSQYDLVAIDEAQFFDDLTLIKKYLMTTDFVIAALSSDSNMNSIGKTLELIPCCNNVIYLQALCEKCCQNSSHTRVTHASFTKKRATTTTDIIDVGGKDKYYPVCRQCFMK